MGKNWDSSLLVLNMLARCVCRLLFQFFITDQLLVDCYCRLHLPCPSYCGKFVRALLLIKTLGPLRMFCVVLLVPFSLLFKDFHIIPMPNPDGYEYTWESDRYWYKNRQIIGPYTECVGLDMNRYALSSYVYFVARLYLHCSETGQVPMFAMCFPWLNIIQGYKWRPEATDNGQYRHLNSQAKPRVPTNPCSHWYPGTRPFESPEVNNIANWIATLPNVVAFVDLRSYGQMSAFLNLIDACSLSR